MSRSSTRGIFLAAILLCSMALVAIPLYAHAEISVKSFAFKETAIIELANESDKGINSFRIWLGGGLSFESLKAEKGWTGTKNPNGVVAFTTTKTVNPGESVKFGVKTDKPAPGINWKALDKDGKEVGAGFVLPEEISDKPPKRVPKEPEKDVPKDDPGDKPGDVPGIAKGMSKESVFRIIPEKPNSGSPIRVTGSNFGASQEFDFYIDSKKLGSFETDGNGNFMTTMKIPDGQEADRVDFKIVDKDGGELTKSIRIEKIEDRIPEPKNNKLTVDGIPKIAHRGDFLEISGTGDPSSAVAVKFSTPEGKIINARTAEIDYKGNWKLAEPIGIALDAIFGKYSITVTDGRQEIPQNLTIESSKVIVINSNKIRFEPGETMEFRGTGLPDVPVEVAIENPLGMEVFSDIIKTNSSGFIQFEFKTTQNTVEGTYAVVASQKNEIEFIFVGLGQVPSIPVNLEFDKAKYKSSETAIISFTGARSTIISLVIVDPTGKPIENWTSVTLQADGRGTHSLDLKGYSSGIYAATASKGSAQSTKFFAVGTLVSAKEIDIITTKTAYLPGEPILTIADTDKSVLITATLINPEGEEVWVKEVFSNNKVEKKNKVTKYSQSFVFRIPSDGIAGTWTISAKSGAIFDNVEIEVVPTLADAMHMTVKDGVGIPGAGKSIDIRVTGAKNAVDIEIIDMEGKVIETLSFPPSKSGEVNQPWIIPKDTEPGTYTIKASDSVRSAEITYIIRYR